MSTSQVEKARTKALGKLKEIYPLTGTYTSIKNKMKIVEILKKSAGGQGRAWIISKNHVKKKFQYLELENLIEEYS